MELHPLNNFFSVDLLAQVMITLVGTLGLIITLFSWQYLEGDQHRPRFLGLMITLILAIVGLVCADNLFVFLLLWAISNTLLVKLMGHETQWPAARASSLLTGTSFFFGFFCISFAFSLLFFASGTASIHAITRLKPNDSISQLAMILLIIGAMTQSGIWPFHKWLISSLNSPTPVSAIMHAGLVNGGGFLLARFASLYLAHPKFLITIFCLGMFSTILGSLWKLMQPDVKKMLACSTLSQMGFMFAQCGLGMFPSAIAHLAAHGFFKANLFLSSNKAAEEKPKTILEPKLTTLFISLIIAVFSLVIFELVCEKSWFVTNTNLFLLTILGVSCTQIALSALEEDLSLKRILAAAAYSCCSSLIYGLSINVIQRKLDLYYRIDFQAMNTVYSLGLFILVAAWALLLLSPYLKKLSLIPAKWIGYFYIKLLNASQPSAKTITCHRKEYRYE